jgi:anaerobic selenocysteine-containing dehydrogenase
MPTVRSFCRVCTSVCGILVEVDGGLQNTTWDACLDDLGAKLRETIARHGPASVGILFGTGVGMDAVGYRIAQSLHAAIGTPARFSPLTIDGTAKVLIAELMSGSQAINGRPDYDNATFAMFIRSNPVVSHGHTVGLPNPRGALRDLAKHAEVWVVDPRYTETARLAAHHLAPRPGTDYAVLAYLVRELLRDGVNAQAQDADVLAVAVGPASRRTTGRLAARSPRGGRSAGGPADARAADVGAAASDGQAQLAARVSR